MEPLSRSSISARGVSVRCTGHRLRMVHTADTINTSLAHSTGPLTARSAILRRKLLNSVRSKQRSAVRPRQYCDRRRRGNTGCRTFPGHLAPMQRGSSTHLRCPARQYCDRRRRGNTGCRTFPGRTSRSLYSLASPQAKRMRAGYASLPTRNDGRWGGSGLFTARGSCLSGHLSGGGTYPVFPLIPSGMQASRCWLRAAHSAGPADGRELSMHEGREAMPSQELGAVGREAAPVAVAADW